MRAVDPAGQRRGVGEALVRACLERASAHGCQAVVICTRDRARAAQRLYARLGFVRVPERDWTPSPGINLVALRWGPPASGVGQRPACQNWQRAGTAHGPS
jgi:ribosomal protein S18 acetylase RimI-like enzyme